MRTLLVALSLCVAVLVPATAAQRPGADPDWPCQQRLVPTLSAATFWSGPDPAAAGDWRKEPKVAELVQRITPRRVAAEQGEQALAGFVADVGPQGARDRLLTLAFAGLLEETNRERIALIERIRDLGHRQRGLADIASEAGEELRQIPPTATGDEAARRTDLEQRFEFVTRAFDSGQRTIRYVCDAPVQLEARLGRYARFLQNHR